MSDVELSAQAHAAAGGVASTLASSHGRGRAAAGHRSQRRRRSGGGHGRPLPLPAAVRRRARRRLVRSTPSPRWSTAPCSAAGCHRAVTGRGRRAAPPRRPRADERPPKSDPVRPVAAAPIRRRRALRPRSQPRRAHGSASTRRSSPNAGSVRTMLPAISSHVAPDLGGEHGVALHARAGCAGSRCTPCGSARGSCGRGRAASRSGPATRSAPRAAPGRWRASSASKRESSRRPVDAVPSVLWRFRAHHHLRPPWVETVATRQHGRAHPHFPGGRRLPSPRSGRPERQEALVALVGGGLPRGSGSTRWPTLAQRRAPSRRLLEARRHARHVRGAVGPRPRGRRRCRPEARWRRPWPASTG